MRRIFSGNRAALALSAVALLCAAGGGAYAATSGKTITLCVKSGTGTVYKSDRCARHDTKISWSATGTRGMAGPAGATGPVGPRGPGATAVNYQSTNNQQTTPELVKTVGPLSLYGLCRNGSAPPGQLDGRGWPGRL